jgi:hypothetical protein
MSKLKKVRGFAAGATAVLMLSPYVLPVKKFKDDDQPHTHSNPADNQIPQAFGGFAMIQSSTSTT